METKEYKSEIGTYSPDGVKQIPMFSIVEKATGKKIVNIGATKLNLVINADKLSGKEVVDTLLKPMYSQISICDTVKLFRADAEMFVKANFQKKQTPEEKQAAKLVKKAQEAQAQLEALKQTNPTLYASLTKQA
jgi:hypothetical protein